MQSKVILATIILVVIIIGGGVMLAARGTTAPQYSNINEFAMCLTEKQVVMYGAAWCSHCQSQKRLFGDAFKQVTYVECPDNPQKCLDAKVNSYPTWLFPDGQRAEGEQSLEKLSQLSGCSLR